MEERIRRVENMTEEERVWADWGGEAFLGLTVTEGIVWRQN